jgi:hypothetical protein
MTWGIRHFRMWPKAFCRKKINCPGGNLTRQGRQSTKIIVARVKSIKRDKYSWEEIESAYQTLKEWQLI